MLSVTTDFGATATDAQAKHDNTASLDLISHTRQLWTVHAAKP